MLTRVLFALILICGVAAVASAEDAKVIALGITTHEVSQAEIEKGDPLLAPHFNTPAIAYVLAANLKKGDVVDIELVNGDTSLDLKPKVGEPSTLLRTPRCAQISRASARYRRGLPSGSA